jgi:GNAT superfamily N-acetyltransferase
MSSEPEIRELLPLETGLAFEAMRELRTDLSDERSFIHQVDEVQRPEGYRLIAAFEAEAPEPSAVAGFRTSHSLSWGHYLYVDDLSTKSSERRRAYARKLLEWLIDEGRRLDCDQFHLDSGVGIDRADAHRLYLNAGLVISAHHFARYVE